MEGNRTVCPAFPSKFIVIGMRKFENPLEKCLEIIYNLL